MQTRHLLDPELAPLLDLMPPIDFSAGITPFRELVLPEVPLSEGCLEPQIRSIPGPAGAPDIGLHIYVPPGHGEPRPAVLHIHGGGMVIGSAGSARASLSAIAQNLDAIAVSVEYRLAPETPFPGPQEDCYAALAWLARHGAEIGVDTSRIVIMGESAGGGLAAALALMARDRGECRLAGQVLTYPMLDYRTGGPQDVWRNPHTGEFLWTREANQFGWTSLRGDYALDDRRQGWFSPALAADLSGLPPTFIGVGALDLFLDEDIDYARRLIAAGIPVDLDVYAGAPHGFDLLTTAAASKRLQEGLSRALRRFLA